jgi:hypothetical protein
MASLLGVIQFYPALGKLATDVSSYWWGVDPLARERILQHKIDDAQQQLTELLVMMEKVYKRPLMVDASTQTEGE